MIFYNINKNFNLSSFNVEKGINKDENNELESSFQNDDNVINFKLKYNKKIIGEIESFKEKDEKLIYLNKIILDKKYRNKGIGKKIFKKYLDEVKKQKDFNKIILEVDSESNHINNLSKKQKIENNKKLIKFYESFGFKIKENKDLYTKMELNF